MKKTFDCVEMKHQRSAQLAELFATMSREEQLEFWRKRTAQLRQLQARMLQQQKSSSFDDVLRNVQVLN